MQYKRRNQPATVGNLAQYFLTLTLYHRMLKWHFSFKNRDWRHIHQPQKQKTAHAEQL